VAQGILNLVAEDIDRKISPNSLAFRINPKRNESNRQKFFKSWYREWPKFVRRIRQSVSQTHPCLVVTDIAGYFEQIDLRILSDMLLTAEVPREVIDLIFTQLEKWTWRDGFVASKTRGLLQGNDVASVYANYYLSDVDEEMSGGTLIFQRFMDDINIHVASKSDGKRALSNLGIALRKKGLTLNCSKTTVVEGAEIDRHFSWDVSDALEANLNDLRQLGDVVAVRHERQRLRRVILNLAVPNPHLLKRLITAYTWARDRRFVKEAVALLEANPDLTPKLTSYFRSLPTDRPLLSVVDFLDDPARNVFPAQEQALIENLLLASISRAPTQQRLAALARSKSGDLSVDPYSRALYVLLAYRCGEIVDLERLVDRYLANQEHDILPRKHLALCVTRLNDPARLQTVVDRLVQEADPSLR